MTPIVFAQRLVVDCTNSAPGVFSYTFHRGPADEVLGISPTNGSIGMFSAGVIAIEDPAGWTHSIDSSGFISWTVTNGLVYLDDPITFTVRSCLREVQSYPPLDPHVDFAGIVTGGAYHLPDLGGAATLEGFNYIGPARTPLGIEFTATNLLLQWPVTSSNFTLQAAFSLDPSANWSPVTNQPVIGESNVVVTVENTNTCFFRLASPCSVP